MLKFVGKALAGLVLTKDARNAIERKTGARQPASQSDSRPDAGPPTRRGGAPEPPAADRGEAIAHAQERVKDVITPERAALIRQAMQVRAAKQKILSELDDKSRAKLVMTAMRALLNEGRQKE